MIDDTNNKPSEIAGEISIGEQESILGDDYKHDILHDPIREINRPIRRVDRTNISLPDRENVREDVIDIPPFLRQDRKKSDTQHQGISSQQNQSPDDIKSSDIENHHLIQKPSSYESEISPIPEQELHIPPTNEAEIRPPHFISSNESRNKDVALIDKKSLVQSRKTSISKDRNAYSNKSVGGGWGTLDRPQKGPFQAKDEEDKSLLLASQDISQESIDFIWRSVVIAIQLILLGSAFSVILAVYLGVNSTPLISIFSTVLAFLGGLLAPSPFQNKIGVRKITPQVAEFIWVTIIITAILIFLGSGFATIIGVFKGANVVPLISIFSSVVAFLGGLLAPSPMQYVKYFSSKLKSSKNRTDIKIEEEY